MDKPKTPFPRFYDPPKQGPLLRGQSRYNFNEINVFIFEKNIVLNK
tara:strand:- start:456 stop:593 length:138 start_codon:yes stop_codon:yes gene_type:complete